MTQTIQTIYDNDNEFPWESITRTFTDGVIQTEERVMDNGIVHSSEYRDGGLLARRSDVDTDNVMNWAERYQSYYNSGVVAFREIWFDNGVYRGFTYDEEGRSLQKYTEYTDGDTRLEYYQNGVLTHIMLMDDTTGTGLNTKPWTWIGTDYNADGTVQFRSIQYDDGSFKFEDYLNGVLSKASWGDDQDAHDWSRIRYAYDASGKLATKTKLMDDTDEFIFLYEEEEITTRLHFDNDDSHSWYLRMTEYGDTGNVITTYNTYDDVPPEYQEWIGIA